MPLTERALIRRIRLRSGHVPGVLGIGDDCASIKIPRSHEALVTTDLSLEDVHFRTAWQPARSVGHRCLVRGFSDIGAMGGRPLAVFLSMAVPATLRQAWIDQFLDGLLKLASDFEVTLAGGDTSKSPAKILADIVVLGSVPAGKAILRSGAHAGDRIYVTGTLGGAASTLRKLLAGGKKEITPADLRSYFYPTPRIEAGRVLREKKLATSMIDISDGLSTDLSHLCEESGLGAQLDGKRIPLARSGTGETVTDLQSALHGGDDYELLFTAAPNVRVPSEIADIAVTEIGTMKKGRGIFIKLEGEVRPLHVRGWEHFRE